VTTSVNPKQSTEIARWLKSLRAIFLLLCETTICLLLLRDYDRGRTARVWGSNIEYGEPGACSTLVGVIVNTNNWFV
jgi:hypothetical protein